VRCRSYPLAEYTRGEHGQLHPRLVEPRQEVLWSPVNPYPQDTDAAVAQFPRYFGGQAPIKCTVHQGEVLYLPGMWYHYVQQTPDESGRVIAVNYWHDMRFDSPLYAYFKHVESVSVALGYNEPGPEEGSAAEDGSADEEL